MSFFVKKNHDHKNIPINNPCMRSFFFYMKKVYTQGFNDILSGFMRLSLTGHLRLIIPIQEAFG